MRYKGYIWFLWAVFLLKPLGVEASHIVGGELYYTCVGNNNYRITLKVYRDCFNGMAPYDNPAAIGIFNSSGGLVQNLAVTFPGSANVPPQVISPCLIPPGNVCVEEAIYETVVNLPPIAGGYDIVYQRCCRNNTINNIINPGNTGSTYYAHIPDPGIVSCNSSPRYNNFPPLFLCVDVPFNFDHAATDPDGDSLVYSLCPAYDGANTANPQPNPPDPPPYNNVLYTSPYSGSYPLNSGPNILQIGSGNGYLTGTPTALGQFVTCVCVSEYRNGQLISTNRRDFQFNVLFCQAAIASIPSQTVFCDGFTVDFLGSSINGNHYFWNFGDPTTTTDTSSNPVTQYTYPDSGVYNVMLVAYDPAGNCYDTAYSQFQVYPMLEPSFTAPPAQCLQGNSFSFTAGGAFTSDATFLWQFGAGASPATSTQQNPTGITYSTAGLHPVALTISQYGCTETFMADVKTVAPPVAAISNVNQYCVGLTVNFQEQCSGATAFLWDFGDPTTNADTSTLSSPAYTYPDTGIYTVRLYAFSEGICSDTVLMNFWVYPLLQPDIIGAGDQCLVSNSYDFQASGAFTTDATFSWNFGSSASPNLSVDRDPQDVIFSSLGQYPVNLTISQYGCVKSTTDTVGLFNTPQANFGILNGFGCAPLRIKLSDSSSSDTPLIYNWNFGDNSSGNEQHPGHVFITPGTYDITLTVYTTSGCVDTSVYVLNNAVTVIAPPVAGFSVVPLSTSIFEPWVTITDSSKLATACKLKISDGTIIDYCNYQHTFTDTGYFRITQYVYNEWNCMDSLSVRVYIEPEYRLFIPDAFTPNGDGINDVFRPVNIGVKDFKMYIFDRWGDNIAQIFDSQAGWDGTINGNPCPIGAYVYQLKVLNIKGESRTFTGRIVLVR